LILDDMPILFSYFYMVILRCKAVELACSLLKGVPPTQDHSPCLFDDQQQEHAIPELPVKDSTGLLPFAKIVTQRSTWKADNNNSTSEFHNLSVDFDTTDFGYAVGEVEAVVAIETEVERARNSIQQVIAAICCTDDGTDSPSSSSSPSDEKAMSKLESTICKRIDPRYIRFVSIAECSEKSRKAILLYDGSQHPAQASDQKSKVSPIGQKSRALLYLFEDHKEYVMV